MAHAILFALIVPVLATSSCFASEAKTDARFLDGLRGRELFELAETYCQQRLAEQNLTNRERAELTIQWARTLAQRAACAPPARQPILWRQAKQILDTWLAREPDSPWRVLVAMQRALISQAQGELVRHEAQAGFQADAALQLARKELREAVGQLTRLVEQVDQMQIAAQRAPGGRAINEQAKTFSTDELISLGRNARYQLSKALMNQAQCYDRDSADRAHSLTQAARWLDELTGLAQADPVVWKSRLARARCYRLLSDHASAASALAWIDQHQPPSDVALRSRIETVRLALDQDQVDRAIELMTLPKTLAKLDLPEWDYARLEICIAARNRALLQRDKVAANLWSDRVMKLIHRFRVRHGAYWASLAEMHLYTKSRQTTGDGDLDMLVLAAKNAYLSGQLNEAVARYEQAATAAAKKADRMRALELGYMAAMILQKQQRHEEAARQCRRWAVEMADVADAAKVHLDAIRNQAQALKQTSANSLDPLVTLLEEHLRKWPHSPTVAEARWLLGGAWRYRRDWDRAIAAYQGIAPDDARFANVPDAVGACCEARLAELRASGQPVDAQAKRMAAWFESIMKTPDGRLAQRISPAARRAVLWAARLQMQSANGGYEQARRLLTHALATAPDAPDDWRREAEAILAVALVGTGRMDEAAGILAQLATAPADVVLDVLARLERFAKTFPPDRRTRLAEVQLQAVDLLGRRQSELSTKQRLVLQRVRAAALADAGRGEEALGQYAALIRAYPNDGTIREAHAKLLSGRNDQRSLESALTEWRQIERRAKPASPRWFRAKYAMAELHLRLGRADQAEKIIRLVALLHPNLGGPEMKPRFEQLLARCQR